MYMTDAAKAKFLVEGTEVAVVNTSGWGARLVATSTIAKVLKTQVVLANGRRFKVSDLEEHGSRSRFYADRIVPADAPLIAHIHREERLREAENAARTAVEHWLKSRRDPSRVAEVAAQMTTYQRVLTETNAAESAESEED